MHILVLTGGLYPIPSNNANLLSKLLKYLAEEHEVRILSTTLYSKAEDFPAFFRDFPVYWIEKSSVFSMKRKYAYPAISKIVDPKGNSDALNVLYIQERLKTIRKEYSYDAIVSTSEPYPAAAAAAASTHGIKRILYLMDPPEIVRDEVGTKYRNQHLAQIISAHDAVLTTPFIKDALIECTVIKEANKVIPVGFPMIEKHSMEKSTSFNGKYKLLFSGWMCSELRSPTYFLDIVSRLDARFEITFMGKECELLQERFPTKTKAKLITLPNQPYDVALQAMADADVLINIGNSVPVHMPSKTLEYINTGKPMVNFYKFADCPTLYYTKRYQLALNLFEGNDVNAAVEQFVRFCEQNVGKTVDREWIEKEYADCTPQYIAQKIIDNLEI